MTKNIVLSIFFLMLIISCKQHGGSSTLLDTKDVNTITIHPQPNTPLYYSEFIDSIQYIPLETPENVLLGANVFKIIFAKHNYYVFDETKVVVFDKHGRYLFVIGKKGNGPGEMIWPTDFIVDSITNTVEILSVGDQKISRYNLFTGEFISDFIINFPAENLFKVDSVDYIFYGFPVNASGENKIDNLVFYNTTENNKMVTTLTYPSFLFKLRGNSNNSFSEINGGILFMRMLDNNIYLIDKNDQIKVKYKIDYGKHNLPIDEKTLGKFKYLDDIIKSSDYVVQFSGFYGNDNYLFFYFYYHYGFSTIYDIKDKKLLYGDSEKNDKDQGPICYVVGLYNNCLIGIIEPVKFIKHFNTLKETLGLQKWREYIAIHPNIKKVLHQINPQDNQILMLCYLKDKF